ncbi:hypothetical protein SL103_20790 [Streptomyces lydicus]|uniref:Uncharacterized protein n=1 Tax=Streptomyces lydicus TaxID=47763 RepID=A0A1D7VNM0_9ACTN|nr:hypothetical protein SL103_20790 [Streptomyces lydicus]
MTGYLRASAGLSGRWRELFRTCARLADGSTYDEDREEAVLQATCITLCLPAQRIGQLTEQIQDLERRLARLVERHASQLLTAPGRSTLERPPPQHRPGVAPSLAVPARALSPGGGLCR